MKNLNNKSEIRNKKEPKIIKQLFKLYKKLNMFI